MDIPEGIILPRTVRSLIIPVPCISESCTEIKTWIFITSLWCLKRFYRGLKDENKNCVKIKISSKFFSSRMNQKYLIGTVLPTKKIIVVYIESINFRWGNNRIKACFYMDGRCQIFGKWILMSYLSLIPPEIISKSTVQNSYMTPDLSEACITATQRRKL